MHHDGPRSVSAYIRGKVYARTDMSMGDLYEFPTKR